ncbi:MAG: hypothetical protein QM765_43570 [Myxococcales bacterium]
MKISGTKLPSSAGKASGELSRAEQDSILKLVNEEKRASKKPAMTIKYMVPPPKPSPEKPPVAAKYMVVRPPADNGGKPPVAAKYMVVPSPIVAKYMVVPPWAGVDAHQAVINKATKNGVVSLSEATAMAKLFNRDIAHADKEGRNIRSDVAKFLKAALGSVKMSDKAKDVLFGQGSPGALPKPPGKNDDHPIYILPPKKDDKPIYILPPNIKVKK